MAEDNLWSELISTYLSNYSFQKGVRVHVLSTYDSSTLIVFSRTTLQDMMSNPNNSILYQVVSMNSTVYENTALPETGFHVGSVLSQIWSLVTLWRLLIALLVLGNLKNIPLIWHVGTSPLSNKVLHLTNFTVADHQCFQILYENTETENACYTRRTVQAFDYDYTCSIVGD